MKRTFKYALTMVLGAALVTPALAQDNFPDVPDNHWAFEALARMKRDGLLVGYPDGLFRGGRPASRYELAVAIHATYVNLKNITDGLDSQIKAINEALGGAGNSGEAIRNLRDQLTALQNDVNTMKGYGEDIANLRRLTDTFQRELQSLGVDVQAMKRDLGDLADRVARLEKRKPAVDVSGDVNLFVYAGNSRDRQPMLDMDGRFGGVGSDPLNQFNNPVGLTEDLNIFHEAAFTLSGTNEEGPKWRGTIVTGNLFGGYAPNQSSLFGGVNDAAAGEFYVQELGVKFDTSVAGLAFNAEVGRVGYKVSPMIFQRIDNTSYFSNERWDNGNYYIDGAVLGFNFGGAKLDVFGGRTSQRNTNNGNDLNPLQLALGTNQGLSSVGGLGGLTADRLLGVNFNAPLAQNGNVNLAYLWHESNSSANLAGGAPTSPAGPNDVNRLAVLGGSVSFMFDKIKLEGGYSQSNLQYNGDNRMDDDNTALYAKIGYTGDQFNLFGAYKNIKANYLAAGDWGRYGILRNPTNIEGFQVGGGLNLGGSLRISASGEFYEGAENRPGAGFFAGTLGSEDDELTKYEVKLDYRLNPNLGLMLGYEETEFDFAAANQDTKFRFTTFGLGYGLSSNATLNLQYQLGDHRGFNTNLFPFARNEFKGGLLTTQLSIKF